MIWAGVAQLVDAPVLGTGCWEFESPLRHQYFAVVAKLVNALDSRSSGVTPLEVRVLSTAPALGNVPRKWEEDTRRQRYAREAMAKCSLFTVPLPIVHVLTYNYGAVQ